jgi:hypothetical protein
LGRRNGIERIGPLRRAARRVTALLALAAGGVACAALPGLVSGAGTAPETKRMVGHGATAVSASVDASHSFDIRCEAPGSRQKLSVRWGSANRFRLTRLSGASCIDDLNLRSSDAAAGFDTLIGRGEGRHNGRRGATVRFRFTDRGESGATDSAYIRVRDASGATVLELNGKLHGGDHRAR